MAFDFSKLNDPNELKRQVDERDELIAALVARIWVLAYHVPGTILHQPVVNCLNAYKRRSHNQNDFMEVLFQSTEETIDIGLHRIHLFKASNYFTDHFDEG